MLSTGLWRWYINLATTILDIIQRSVLYLKHNVSETGFWLRLRIEVVPIQISSLCLRTFVVLSGVRD
jgi:hypothetical protein